MEGTISSGLKVISDGSAINCPVGGQLEPRVCVALDLWPQLPLVLPNNRESFTKTRNLPFNNETVTRCHCLMSFYGLIFEITQIIHSKDSLNFKFYF